MILTMALDDKAIATRSVSTHRLSVASSYAMVLICAVRSGLRDKGGARVFRDQHANANYLDWRAHYDHV